MNYLTRSWYCAGWSTDLQDQPKALSILEQPVVIYRGEGGTPIALAGACPHRFAPLAQGKVLGNNIMCPYHGLTFDREGACVFNPHGQQVVPPNARLRSYPIVEKDGVLWIWMGEADAADPSLITTTGLLQNKAYAFATGYLRIEANYQLVIDNLLDLTHAPFLHFNTIASHTDVAAGEILPEDIAPQLHVNFRLGSGNSIHSDYLGENFSPSQPLIPFWRNRQGDFRAEMHWRPASNLELDVFMCEPKADKTTGIHMPSLHYLTPESETLTHYFFAAGRNVLIDDEELTRSFFEVTQRAFKYEDEPMIKACQAMMKSTDLMAMKPAILETDRAAVQARRILARQIADENGQVSRPETKLQTFD